MDREKGWVSTPLDQIRGGSPPLSTPFKRKRWKRPEFGVEKGSGKGGKMAVRHRTRKLGREFRLEAL